MKRFILYMVAAVTVLVLGGAISLAPAYNNNYTTDLYVDCVNGQDTQPLLSSVFGGACSSATSPCHDPQYAINQLNRTVSSQATVHLLGPTDGGTPYTCYADNAADAGAQATIEIDGFSVNLGVNPQAGLTIDCAVSPMIAPVTATGFTAGTSTSPPLLTVSTASWTPSAFKGQFVRVLSGTGYNATSPIENYFTIIDNDATNLVILYDGMSFDSTTIFDIVQPAVAISDALASAPSTSVTTYALDAESDLGANSAIASFWLNTTQSSAKAIISHCAIVSHQSNAFSGAAFHAGGSNGVMLAADAISGPGGCGYIDTSAVTAYRSVCTPGTSSNAFTLNGHAFMLSRALEVASSGSAYAINDGSFVRSTFSYYTGSSSSAVFSGGVGQNSGLFQLDYFNTIKGFLVEPGQEVTSSSVTQYGSPTALATVISGGLFVFNSSTTTTASNFISLDNGSTYVSKATIEAATNKTICTIGTGGTPLGCAKEQ